MSLKEHPHSSSLTRKDHPQITQHLKPLNNHELTNVGLRLGLHYRTLRKMNQGSLLNEMVHAWLRRDDDVAEVVGEPNWESLGTALENCGHKGIASEIIREVGAIPIASHTAKPVSVSSSSPQLQDASVEMMDEHFSYHQAITGEEAKERLKRCTKDGHGYLTRYSERHGYYVLTVYQNKIGRDIIKHFQITFETIRGQREYNIKGKTKRFVKIDEMLTYYRTNRIDPALESIGQCVTESEYERVQLQMQKPQNLHPEPASEQGGHENQTDPYTYHQLTMSLTYTLPPKKDMMGEHQSYHQSITTQEAEQRLKTYGKNSYLTRYSISQKSYILSVYRKQHPEDVIKHFVIVVENGKHKLKGREEEEFETIDALIEQYEGCRLDQDFPTIGQCYSEETFNSQQEAREGETYEDLKEKNEKLSKELNEVKEQLQTLQQNTRKCIIL